MAQKQRFQRSGSRGHCRPCPAMDQESFPTRHVLQRRGDRFGYQCLFGTVSGDALDREGEEHTHHVDIYAFSSAAIVPILKVQIMVVAGQLLRG